MAKIYLAVLAIWVVGQSTNLHANPYVSKPGENAVTVRAAACAITGGFIHLYSALD